MPEQTTLGAIETAVDNVVAFFIDDNQDTTTLDLRTYPLTVKTAVIDFDTYPNVRVWTVKPDDAYDQFPYAIAYCFDNGRVARVHNVYYYDMDNEEEVAYSVEDAPGCETFHRNVTSWQRHELDEQTWVNVATTGGATVKQIQGDDMVVVYLSAAQVQQLVHALSQNQHVVVR